MCALGHYWELGTSGGKHVHMGLSWPWLARHAVCSCIHRGE